MTPEMKRFRIDSYRGRISQETHVETVYVWAESSYGARTQAQIKFPGLVNVVTVAPFPKGKKGDK